jgi:hypothetical protein
MMATTDLARRSLFARCLLIKLLMPSLGFTLSLVSFPVFDQQPLPPDVQALEQKYQAETDARVNRPYQVALADLNEK